MLWRDAIITAEGSHIIALTLPQTHHSASAASNETGGYFPLSEALTSVMRLAVNDINAATDADSLTTEGNLTLSVVGVETGTRAMEGLCDALESVGENGTFGVSYRLHTVSTYSTYKYTRRGSSYNMSCAVVRRVLVPGTGM